MKLKLKNYTKTEIYAFGRTILAHDWIHTNFAWPICKYVYLFIRIHCCCIHWLDQYYALNRTSVVFNICLHWLGVSLYLHQLFIYLFIHLFFIYFDSVIITTIYMYRNITYSTTMLCTHHAVSHYSQLYSSVISDVISFYIH